MKTNDWLSIVDGIGPEFAKGAAERDATDGFIAEHYPVLRESGLVTALVPAEFGGGGATHADMCAILRRLGRYDGPTALALSMHQHLIATQAFRHSRGLPAPVLKKVADNKLVLISTGARDWLQSNGNMVKVDGGYRVTARKAFASGSPAGNVAVTSAQYKHPDEGWQVLHFPVPMKSEGVRLEMDWKAHGMRSTGSNTIVFDSVFVPDEAIAVTRPRDEFPMVWHVVIGVALPLICSAYVGVAENAAQVALKYGVRNAESVTTQWSAGEMASDLVLAQSCLNQMVQLTNEYEFTPSAEGSSQMLALKTHTVEAVQRVCDKAIEVAGGAGFYRRTGLERLLRDARAGHFHPLSRKPQLQFSGRVALGLDPVEF
jgi:alkylation response protein AidB-like acyl-CoA dehydrogenase